MEESTIPPMPKYPEEGDFINIYGVDDPGDDERDPEPGWLSILVKAIEYLDHINRAVVVRSGQQIWAHNQKEWERFTEKLVQYL